MSRSGYLDKIKIQVRLISKVSAYKFATLGTCHKLFVSLQSKNINYYDMLTQIICFVTFISNYKCIIIAYRVIMFV